MSGRSKISGLGNVGVSAIVRLSHVWQEKARNAGGDDKSVAER
jgi:hypothetical protein